MLNGVKCQILITSKMSIYPKCATSFMEFVQTDKILLNKFVSKIK